MGNIVEPATDRASTSDRLSKDESMKISHEAIYRALYIQERGALRRELTACLRTDRVHAYLEPAVGIECSSRFGTAVQVLPEYAVIKVINSNVLCVELKDLTSVADTLVAKTAKWQYRSSRIKRMQISNNDVTHADSGDMVGIEIEFHEKQTRNFICCPRLRRPRLSSITRRLSHQMTTGKLGRTTTR